MSIRVLVADDHEAVRAGLRSLLHGTEIKIVGEVGTGEAVLRLTKKHNPDVVLLDIQMPDKDGLWALGRLKVDFHELPVLIFSAFDIPAFVARAVALGAQGYVLKSAAKEKLVDAIRSAAAGQTTWTREELRRVTGALATPRLTADVEVPLTQRESEVLKQLALGATNKEIAVALHISYETVKEHVQHILRKIGVTDRTQAAVWAVRKSLV
jgi:DNA-binding NarL/FixJ family response regulator